MERTTIWSTHKLESECASSVWNEAISSAFLRVQTQPRHPSRPFHAYLKSEKAGDLSINQLQAQSYQVICNTEDQFNDWLFINQHRAGLCQLQQYGRSQSIGPGELSINVGSSPFTFDFDDGVAMTCVRLPLVGPLAHSGLIHDFVARPLPTNAGGPLLHDYLTSLVQNFEQLALHQVELASRCLLNLVTMLIDGDPCAQNDSSSFQQILYERACAYIKMHVADSSLTLQRVSDHVNLAPRTLQSLFQRHNTTFRATLLEARLLAADQLLANHSRLLLSEIAYAVGFSDQAHFSNAYRRRFDVSPSERRHRSTSAHKTQ